MSIIPVNYDLSSVVGSLPGRNVVLSYAEGLLDGVPPASGIHQRAGVQTVRLIVG